MAELAFEAKSVHVPSELLIVVLDSSRSESPGRSVNTQLAGPHPRISDSVSLLRGQGRICISNEFPGDADAGGPGTRL